MAAIRSLKELGHDYFREAGFDDYELTTVFHQWMGGFPESEPQAFSVISWGGAVATLAGATKVIVKTPHEAMGIPTKEANLAGLKCTRQIVNMLSAQPMPQSGRLDEEVEVIREEVKTVMDRVRDLGEGDLAAGAARAFEAGVIDIPFAPAVCNNGKLLPVRDNEGFIRLFKPGAVPLSPRVEAFHRERIAQRARAERREASFQMVIDDIYAISKGRLVGRPR
jgi:methylaspartate mutase epsilon subunit